MDSLENRLVQSAIETFPCSAHKLRPAFFGEGIELTRFQQSSRRPVVFLDRDGTVNAEVHYLSAPEQLVLLPTVGQTISMLNSRGIAVVIVTNQAGIARGIFPEERIFAIHARLEELLDFQQAKFDGIYYCPHHPTAGLGDYRIECECRKPMPGMLKRAAQELNLDLHQSLMIGDRETDLQAGANAGCLTALVRTGYGLDTEKALDLKEVSAIGSFDTVAAAVDAWLDRTHHR